VSKFDATSIRLGTASPRGDQDTPTIPTNLVDELLPAPASSHSGLTGGIVWADVLADIAADEEARQLRNAA
jgi:hypothetical protein